MTKNEFIESIGALVVRIAPEFWFKAYSAIIAQACLESAYGTSDKAQHNNFFGLKYREGRVSCHDGYFNADSQEQFVDGTYVPTNTDWYSFASMEDGVRGYFQFLGISRYENLIGVSDPKMYLQLIKEDGYATSTDYVDNVYNTLTSNNLQRFDSVESEVSIMSNSPLVNYTKISPNKTSPRNHAIDTITIHCMAGNLSVEACGNVFAPESRQASSNYGVGSDGRVGMYVEEKDRSWCSSNGDNDHRAVTIEVANDGNASTGWHVSDTALAKTIELCADICRRNDIKKLLWSGDKSLIGQVDKQNMTVHRWFANKSCPGDYLYSKHSYIADEVNKLLGVSSEPASLEDIVGLEVVSFPATPFTVSVTISDLNIRCRASMSGLIKGQTGVGTFTITDVSEGWGRLKSGAGWIYIANPDYCTVNGTVQASAPAPTVSKHTLKSVDEIANEVLAGSWGNGADRKARLEAAGYNYSGVQSKVNELVSGTSTPTPSKSVDEYAREVIQGKWGNGTERKARIEADGGDYSAVQKRVNELLG